MLARGEHRDDRFGASNRFGGRCYTRAARFDGARERLFAQVEGADVVARLREVRGHAAAHVPESAQGDFHIFSTPRSEEHTSDLPSQMRISYAVFCLQKKTT